MSTEDSRLTHYTRFSGCGAKLGPGVLEKALCGLEQPAYPELIADYRGCEDAGMYRLSASEALVETVDFFPPIVDDPFLFGRIAAANALSDIYAMGGRPIGALALVCFPVRTLGLDTLRTMMKGGLDSLIEAGCALLGGHSIEDSEPKLGYAVSGLVDPARAWRNNSAKPGDSIIITKPLGVGLVNMALRAGIVSDEAKAAAEKSMSSLNKKAAEILRHFTVDACTDVTGFGLAGHAAEMAAGSGAGLRLRLSSLPIIPEAREYAAMGLVPEGTYRNREGRLKFISGADALTPLDLDLIFSPETSGGLLAALPEAEAEKALAALREAGVDAAIIGDTMAPAGSVEVLR